MILRHHGRGLRCGLRSACVVAGASAVSYSFSIVVPWEMCGLLVGSSSGIRSVSAAMKWSLRRSSSSRVATTRFQSVRSERSVSICSRSVSTSCVFVSKLFVLSLSSQTYTLPSEPFSCCRDPLFMRLRTPSEEIPRASAACFTSNLCLDTFSSLVWSVRTTGYRRLLAKDRPKWQALKILG
jgi:hypothetical protein